MYRHILVPTDGSPVSLKAAKAAAKLARTMKAKLTALYVIAPFAPPSGAGYVFSDGYIQKQYMEGMRKHADQALAKVKRSAAAERVTCEAISVIGRTPWEAIIAAARSRKCDLVVMGSHGRRGLMGVLLGSETTKVLTHSKVPVLVCR
ncbi:MAG TPA: universal stress protein [Usitatibacter sp.]|nr:universal stress protein [Usitatibacter sp.]